MSCQAGCLTADVLATKGLTFADLYSQPASNGNGNGNGSSWHLKRTHQYERADGSPAYEVLVWETPTGKMATPRWKAPDGKWVNGSKAGEYYLVPYYEEWRPVKPGKTPEHYPRQNWPELDLTLYKLPRLIAAPSDEIVFVVEGEKDADNLTALGLLATSPTGGANRKWELKYSKILEARSIVIIPDNDDAGEKHADKIINSLGRHTKKAHSIILRLPGLTQKGEDISDWLEQGHTIDELKALASAALNPPQAPPPTVPPPVSNPAPQQPPPQKPVIDISPDDLPTLNADCWNAIEISNNPPVLFTYGSTIVRTRKDFEDDSIILDSMTADIMRHELSQMADWIKVGKRGIEETKPPIFLVKDVLASRSIPLPRLNRVVTVPVFAPDGTLQTTPGYNKASGVIYAPPKGYQSLAVPDVIGERELKYAKLLIDELLNDFPFAKNDQGESPDRENAIAMFLLPFVRDMIDGPTPLHLIEASMPGSGKGLLATSCLYPGLGKIAGAPQPRDDEELRKFITSELIALRPVIYLDNISRTIDSGAFAAALTLETWNDRVLGSSATANVKIKSIWLATANNATMSTEITRRTVRIRLTPNTDRPEEREDFLHEDQAEWVMQNRPELVWAAHVICKNAIQQKMPRPKIKNMGSFERYSRTMGSILECAGYKNFLGNYRALQDGSDAERTALSLFAMTAFEWMEREKKDTATNTELLPIASALDGLEFRGKDEISRAMSFGKWIKSKNEVVTEWVEEDPQAEYKITRLKILSGIAGKGTNRGKSVTKIEIVDRVRN